MLAAGECIICVHSRIWSWPPAPAPTSRPRASRCTRCAMLAALGPLPFCAWRAAQDSTAARPAIALEHAMSLLRGWSLGTLSVSLWHLSKAALIRVCTQARRHTTTSTHTSHSHRLAPPHAHPLPWLTPPRPHAHDPPTPHHPHPFAQSPTGCTLRRSSLPSCRSSEWYLGTDPCSAIASLLEVRGGACGGGARGCARVRDSVQ